jgi:hypothetical protein
MSRSSNYKFTTTSFTDSRIANLRAQVSDLNILRRLRGADFRLRVTIHGRLGRDNPNAHLYAQGGPLHRWSSQRIRPEHSTRFDVYVHEYLPENAWKKRLAARAPVASVPVPVKPTLIVDPAF